MNERTDVFWRGVDLGMLLLAADVLAADRRGVDVLELVEKVREEKC